MDRFEAMSMVLAVAEAGGLSPAAHKTSLATVSRKVSDLEAQLRTKLFNRSSRVLVPTDAFVRTSPRRSESLPMERTSRKESNPLSLDLDSYILAHHSVRLWALSGDVTEKRDERAARI
jgi:DNA-binding transcriptional LysR family regulator